MTHRTMSEHSYHGATSRSTMKDRSDDLSHHKRTLLPRSYISLLCLKDYNNRCISLKQETLDNLQYAMACWLGSEFESGLGSKLYVSTSLTVWCFGVGGFFFFLGCFFGGYWVFSVIIVLFLF